MRKRAKDNKYRFDSAKVMNSLAFFVFLAGCALIGFFVYQMRQNTYSPIFQDISEAAAVADASEQEKCKHRRLLDGICVKSESEVNKNTVGVVIGNSAEAWPLSGVSEAGVVYEAPVEGNIPRLLAIYSDSKVGKAGPVRSARPYFMDWISEYGGAAYMHVGGSPEAMERLEEYKDIFNIDEYYADLYFWRSKDRAAPHNTYTSKELSDKAWESYKREQREYESWIFSDMDACQNDCVTNIKVSFGAPAYISRWGYSHETKKYYRLQGYIKQLDQNGDEVSADTVVVQKVKSKVLDNIGRLKIDTIGEGEAIVFRDGHKIDGTWRKDSRNGRTKWLDAEGREIALKAGRIWIEVASQNMEVDWE